MLRITESESATAAKTYFDGPLKRGDYYLEGQEVAGQWGGKGALALGLSGPVGREEFFRLLDNQRPDGGKLTARTVENRRPGYDMCFDVPKSVSLMHAIGGDDRILEAMRTALELTMGDIEQEVHARVRKSGANTDRRTGNMVRADFTHFTSRPVPLDTETASGIASAGIKLARITDRQGEILLPDPHLHVHVYAINATLDPEENEWKAGVFMQAKRDAPYFQAVYHTRLAAELQKLGYAIAPTARAFELAGVSRSLIEKFSRRTKEVEEAAAAAGVHDAKEKAKLGARTRRSKVRGLAMPELKRCWESVAGKNESVRLRALAGEAKNRVLGVARDDLVRARDAVVYAIGKELERVSEVSQRRLLAAALEKSVGSASVESVESALAKRADVLSAVFGGERRMTTLDVLKEEARLLQSIRDAKGSVAPLVYGTYSFMNPLFMKESAKEQRQAIEQLMSSQDWIVGLIGRAGTGKTTLLKEIELGVKRAGSHLVPVAPSAVASRGVLRTEGFGDADTVKRLLVDREFQKKVSGGVLWIDEAGMLGNGDLLALLDLAKRNGARKVVVAGDPTQIRSVPRGDALRFLEENAGLSVARLEKIQRQKRPILKEAVEAISRADMSRGLALLDSIGNVYDGPAAQMHETLAKAYVERSKLKRKSVLVVCPTHREGAQITARIRANLREAGVIGSKDAKVTQTVAMGWTEPEKLRAASYDEGLVVQFRRDVRGFKKSERVRVCEVHADESRVRVLKNDGQTVDLPLEAASKFEVYRLAELPVATGDRLRITQNTFVEEHRFNNGDSVTVAGVGEDGSVKLKNGVTLPPHFGHLTHGYVHTADAAQAKTVDSVLIGIGKDSMATANMPRMYVAVSRARYEAKVFTDDKPALEEATQRDSVRRFATEVIGPERARRVVEWILRRERQPTKSVVTTRTISTKAPSMEPTSPASPSPKMPAVPSPSIEPPELEIDL